MHIQPRVALLFTLAAFLHLSPTIASIEECAQQSQGLPTLSTSSLATSLAAQCPNLATDPTSDCVVDATDSNFANSCKNAGGEVYDYDFTISCPSSSAADGTQTYTVSNFYFCTAKVCTLDDMNANAASSSSSSFGDGCTATKFAIASGSMAIRVSTTLIGALVAGLLFLVGVL